MFCTRLFVPLQIKIAEMSLTGLVRNVFVPRQRQLEQHTNNGADLQRNVLDKLLADAKDTEYGRRHSFADAKGYEDFVNHTPLNTYEDPCEPMM